MAKLKIGEALDNKGVRIAIYMIISLLVLYVMWILVKKLIKSLTERDYTQEHIDQSENQEEDPQEPPSTLTQNQALAIADSQHDAMEGAGTTCSSLFAGIEPYRNDKNNLIMIYNAFGVRDGENLFQWYRDDLSQNCTNGFPWWYPCDIPDDCYDRNDSELSCMRWYWEKSDLVL